MSQKDSKEFAIYEDAVAFMTEKMKEQKYVIHLKPEGVKYTVYWWDHKMTERDGEQVPDELWLTQDGTPILVQDLSEAHCKNILRMILRNQKEDAATLEHALVDMINALGDASGPDIQMRTVVLDQDQIDDDIDALFPADVRLNRSGPTFH